MELMSAYNREYPMPTRPVLHNRKPTERFLFRMKPRSMWQGFRVHSLLAIILSALLPSLRAAETELQKSDVFPPGLNGIARYRIPGIVVTPKGTVLAYAEARRNGSSDWGEIEVHLRRSTDGGKTWQPAQHIAHHELSEILSKMTGARECRR